ncbi:MAG: DUF262 domain-containing protein [Gemmataceae bacterium]|nr:DUF262 domain-containing protein [Gemmataceae bacterium]
MEYIPVRVSDIIRQVNRDIYLPAIQREFVWGTDRIERLFDSIMADFPIGSFLYWKLEQRTRTSGPSTSSSGTSTASRRTTPRRTWPGSPRTLPSSSTASSASRRS